jgi:hypothetical protein
VPFVAYRVFFDEFRSVWQHSRTPFMKDVLVVDSNDIGEAKLIVKRYRFSCSSDPNKASHVSWQALKQEDTSDEQPS